MFSGGQSGGRKEGQGRTIDVVVARIEPPREARVERWALGVGRHFLSPPFEAVAVVRGEERGEVEARGGHRVGWVRERHEGAMDVDGHKVCEEDEGFRRCVHRVSSWEGEGRKVRTPESTADANDPTKDVAALSPCIDEGHRSSKIITRARSDGPVEVKVEADGLEYVSFDADEYRSVSLLRLRKANGVERANPTTPGSGGKSARLCRHRLFLVRLRGCC